MRTTISLDDDVLAAARALATRQHKTLGEVVSELARGSLRREAPAPVARNGIRLLPARDGAQPATLALVNGLRDEVS